MRLVGLKRSPHWCTAGVRIGIIDTGVDVTHPVLAKARLDVISTRSPDRRPSDSEHGTAVVSQLIGQQGIEFTGLALGASVVAVDAFHRSGDQDVANVADLVAALERLVERDVQIVGMSFAGPDNIVLQRAIAKAHQAGLVLIAAAGQADQRDDTGFPARFPEVVAVAAIDPQRRLRPETQRGPHIAFAAPGTSVSVAGPGGSFAEADGSSFAVPFVTAAYAMALRRAKDPEQAARLVANATRADTDERRNDVFGRGIINFATDLRCDGGP